MQVALSLKVNMFINKNEVLKEEEIDLFGTSRHLADIKRVKTTSKQNKNKE